MPASTLSRRLPGLRRSLRRHRRILTLLAVTIILAQAGLAAAARFAPAPPADAAASAEETARLQLAESEAAAVFPVPNEAYAALLIPGTAVEVVCGSEDGSVTRIPGRIADTAGAAEQTAAAAPLTGAAAPSVVIVMERTHVSDALHCSHEIWSSVVMVH